ncbi:alcohol dehydrogenase 1-like isoform X2 [Lepidochelys kempii]|uniref:alcohol dehydrogenase 1-like isoform X2 n=1 Tax=Lepidochelys kempii TaxID=8472 RepID=UPI003C6FCE5C
MPMAALLSCHLGYGTCMLVGEPPSGSQISFDPMLLFSGHQWKESLIGGWKLKAPLPKLVSDYMNKQCSPAALITHTLPYDKINEGFKLLWAGKSIHSILLF